MNAEVRPLQRCRRVEPYPQRRAWPWRRPWRRRRAPGVCVASGDARPRICSAPSAGTGQDGRRRHADLDETRRRVLLHVLDDGANGNPHAGQRAVIGRPRPVLLAISSSATLWEVAPDLHCDRPVIDADRTCFTHTSPPATALHPPQLRRRPCSVSSTCLASPHLTSPRAPPTPPTWYSQRALRSNGDPPAAPPLRPGPALPPTALATSPPSNTTPPPLNLRLCRAA